MPDFHKVPNTRTTEPSASSTLRNHNTHLHCEVQALKAMKSVFSLAALVIALGLTVLLVKKQLGAIATPVPPPATAAPTTPTNQVQQVGQQVQELMQQPRPGTSEP